MQRDLPPPHHTSIARRLPAPMFSDELDAVGSVVPRPPMHHVAVAIDQVYAAAGWERDLDSIAGEVAEGGGVEHTRFVGEPFGEGHGGDDGMSR